jgi:hypothetical protein
MIHGEKEFKERYNAYEKERFMSHINGILNPRIEKEGFETFKRILLNIYANPVVNQLKK